ncbi:MAG: cysteine hydrolase [Alphaproteobacteria bacterium]|nr:cysteine hydrolase [Alphaproteobacteria bacterium]
MEPTNPIATVACWDRRSFPVDRVTTALMVIDMQRDFLDPGGMSANSGENIDALRSIVPILRQILEAARRVGLLVIHTREGYAPDLSDVHRVKAERDTIGKLGPLGRFLIRGEPGHGFIDEMSPIKGEWVIDKPGFGAFYRTNLEKDLHDAGISHLIVTGVTTQCCVLSSIREAVDRGFYCLTIADGCAAFDRNLHDAALATIRGENFLFGWIAEGRAILDALGPTAAGESAAQSG